MPDEPKGVEAAQASAQPGLEAAAAEPQAKSGAEVAAQASAAPAPAPEPDYKAQLESAQQALTEERTQREKLQKDIQNLRTDGGNARELSRQLRASEERAARLESQMAGIAAQLPHLFAGREDEAAKAAEEARRPFEQQRERSVQTQLADHGAAIDAALRKAGLTTSQGGDWYTDQSFASVRWLWEKGLTERDPEMTGKSAELVEILLEGRTNGAATQAQLGNGASPAAAAKASPDTATPQQSRPRAGLDIALGPGVGPSAESSQALINRLARGEFLTTEQMVRAKKAQEEGVYPDLHR